MNLTIDRDPAFAAMSRVVGVVDKNHSIDICSNVLLYAQKGQVVVRGTDLDMEATEVVSADISEDGGITLPAAKLHDIMRSADPGCQIGLGMEDGDPRAKVKAGRSRFSVPALPTTAFPNFPVEGLGPEFTLPGKMLAGMLSRVLWATSKAKGLTPMSCVYFASVGEELHAVGATPSCVALAREPLPQGAEIKTLLLPKTVQRILSWLGDGDQDVHISSSESLIQLRQGEGRLVSKVYGDTNYLNYPRVVMEDHELTATTDQDAVKAALHRALIMADDKSHAVKLEFSPGADGASMTIQARGGDAGEGIDEIPVDYEGPAREILLTAAQLEGALANLRGDQVRIGFAAPENTSRTAIVVVVKAPADPSFLVTLAQPRA